MKIFYTFFTTIIGICLLSSCLPISFENSNLESINSADATPTILATSEEIPVGSRGQIYTITISSGWESEVDNFEIGCLPTELCIRKQYDLFTGYTGVTNLMWNSNGEKLIFLERTGIYIFENQDINQLINHEEYFEGNLQWTPDGNNVVYSIVNNFGVSKIHSYSLLDNTITELLPDVTHPIQIAWSNNGYSAYSYYENKNSALYRTKIIDSTGSESWLIPNIGDLEYFQSWQASFSPDSKWIIYTVKSSENDRIFKANIFSKEIVELYPTSNMCSQSDAKWSPDGNWILFQSNCLSDTNDYELVLISPDGNNIHKLDIDYSEQIYGYAWKPE